MPLIDSSQLGPQDDGCRADLDGDGDVGAFGLAILLGDWGARR